MNEVIKHKRTEIDFSYKRGDYNLMNWIVRVEKEIDEYIEGNGHCSSILASRFYMILEDLMTNPQGELIRELHRVLLDKLKREPVLGDVLVMCKYLKAKLEAKITDISIYREEAHNRGLKFLIK